MSLIHNLFSIPGLKAGLLMWACAAGLGTTRAAQSVIHINADMDAELIATNCYVIRSYAQVPPWGRISGNELLYINGNQALLVNTPWNDKQTEELLDWSKAILKVPVVKAILTHTHDDCMGGISALTNRHIQTISLDLTARKARQEGKPVPETVFSDSIKVHLGDREAEVYYPGAGHTVDNITVWFPAEKILFGGCLVKSAQAQELGNVADADLHAWPVSLRRLRGRYPQAVLIVPGHGDVDGFNAIDRSLELLTKTGAK